MRTYRQWLLPLLMVLGTAWPWYHFSRWTMQHGGFPLDQFLADLTPNAAASGLNADLSITALAFLSWALLDARRLRLLPRWGLCLGATFLVGASLAVPLYLWFRERAVARQAA